MLFGRTQMGDGDNLQVREAFADNIDKGFTFTTMILSTCHGQVFVFPRESSRVILLRDFKSIIYASNKHFLQTSFLMQSKPRASQFPQYQEDVKVRLLLL